MLNSVKGYCCCALTLLAIAHFDAKAEEREPTLVVRANAELFVPSDFVTLVSVITYSERTSLEECQAEADATTQQVIASLVNFGIKISNIYLGEYLMPLCNEPSLRQSSEPWFWVQQEINIDLLDVSELESVVTKLADFPEVNVKTLKPRVFEPEKHFESAIRLATDRASKLATEVGIGMGMSVGKFLKVEKSVALAAYPNERIGVGGGVYEPVYTDLFNESLNQVEIRAEVEITFSLESVNNTVW